MKFFKNCLKKSANNNNKHLNVSLKHIIFFCFSTEILDKGNLVVNTNNQSAEPISSLELVQKMSPLPRFCSQPPSSLGVCNTILFTPTFTWSYQSETNITASKFICLSLKSFQLCKLLPKIRWGCLRLINIIFIKFRIHSVLPDSFASLFTAARE